MAFGRIVRIVIVALAFLACMLATYGSSAQEAYQLITVTDAFLYDIYFGMMFLIPLVVGNRFGKPPGLFLKAAALSGLLVTILHGALSVFPIIDVPHPVVFGIKILVSALFINLVGVFIYRQSRRNGAVTPTAS